MTQNSPSINNSFTLKITSCVDCSFHREVSDPDPHDWFCDDDVKIVCTKTGKNVTVACRPYNTRKETSIPSWCPLLKEGEDYRKR